MQSIRLRNKRIFGFCHVGQNPGTKLVNESITYSDTEGNVVDFPEPAVAVECDVVVNPEESGHW